MSEQWDHLIAPPSDLKPSLHDMQQSSGTWQRSSYESITIDHYRSNAVTHTDRSIVTNVRFSVESVRQLIHSTKKNRRLAKENERFLNESTAWYQEKSFLEKQVKDGEATIELLQKEVQEKHNTIAALEKRVAELLQSFSEHPAEEVSEAAAELILDKKDEGTQCETDSHDVGIQLEENTEGLATLKQEIAVLSAENKELCHKLSNLQDIVDDVSRLRKEQEYLREKCSFLETENVEVRKEEEKLLKDIANKDAELIKIKEEKQLLTDELDRLHTETKHSADLLKKNQELERFQLESEKLLEEHKMQISGLRSCVASYEQTIQSLRECEIDMKKQIDNKLVEAEKLDQECRTLRNVGDKLTQESMFANLLNSELQLKLSQAHSEIDELRSSLSREQNARKTEMESKRCMAELNKKLQESTSRLDELRLLNEKMSVELDYLRQKSANSASKEEMEQLSATLSRCQHDLEIALSEKNSLLEKEEHYRQEIAKTESLRFEIKSRDTIIAEYRSAEEKLQSDLTAKSNELLKIQTQFDELTHECCKIREEYHVFQESAEQQYCAMLEEKCKQIEAISARLAQLESYPGNSVFFFKMFLLFFGQTISIDGTLCTTCAAQKAKQAGDSEKNCLEKAVVAATKRMQDASTPNNMSEPPATSAADTRNGQREAELFKFTYYFIHLMHLFEATTSTSFLEEVDRAGQHTDISSRISDSLSLAQIVACFDNLEDYRLRSDSPDLRPELRRFFARIKYERDINALEAASDLHVVGMICRDQLVVLESTVHFMRHARHFLESCDRVFLDNAKELFRKEIQNIHDCKDALEKLIRLQWSLERENMELQLDRYRRQVEQFPSIHKENVVIKSELNAMKTQIEQYKLKLRQKSEEVERLEIERDRLTVLAKEFQKLDQESQDEVKEANRVIDELERKDKDASAELERCG
ncbi:hypothetical protein NECAME_17321 [Necator americanus]|uniref:Uncharacterized protein n=1 Tax=Necator americanus TaxID=51031 RepID=W2TPZ8_NECAM|nr:hypothetical protein NECAME_17321 [Necator americanus]ETN83843.1 hypothetical protein NECAME_17321 [Necator americanus]